MFNVASAASIAHHEVPRPGGLDVPKYNDYRKKTLEIKTELLSEMLTYASGMSREATLAIREELVCRGMSVV